MPLSIGTMRWPWGFMAHESHGRSIQLRAFKSDRLLGDDRMRESAFIVGEMGSASELQAAVHRRWLELTLKEVGAVAATEPVRSRNGEVERLQS